MKTAIIYCDGSSGQNGYGGWAAITAVPSLAVLISGSAPVATNNSMELTAALMGILELGTEQYEIDLVSDSAYLLNALENRWYDEWFAEERKHLAKGKGPRKLIKGGDPVFTRPNLELWKKLAKLNNFHVINCVKIKGHSKTEGSIYNVWCDAVAVASRKGQTPFMRQILTPNSTKESILKERGVLLSRGA